MRRRALAVVMVASAFATFLACSGDDSGGPGGGGDSGCVTAADCNSPTKDATVSDSAAQDAAVGRDASDAATHAPGSLDLTFGSSGTTTIDFADAGDVLEDLIVLSDGRTIGVGVGTPAGSAEGNIGVAALLANGTLDMTFGAGAPDSGVGAGKITADLGFPGGFSNASQVFSTDAGLTVTAYRFATAAVLRYSASGAIDPSFGTGGTFTQSLVGNQNVGGIPAVALPDGKIVLGGSVHVSVSNDDAFFAELDTSGALDPAFGPADAGTPGFEQIDLDPFDAPLSLARQSSGKIVVAGFFGSTNTTATLYRLDAAGAFDSTFGLGDGGIPGVETLTFGNDDEGQAVAVQSDDKIVVVHRALSTSHVVRYTSAGLLDTAFATSGVYTATVSGFTSISLSSIALAADGKIVLGGFVTDGTAFRKLAVLRLNANGSVDTSFGSNGVAVAAFSAGDARGNSIAIQPDGRIVVGGWVEGVTEDFAFARFWP